MATILDRILSQQDEDAPVPLAPGADPSVLTSSPIQSSPATNLTPEQLAQFQIPVVPEDASMPPHTQPDVPIIPVAAQPAPTSVTPVIPEKDESDSDDYDNSSGKKLSAKVPDKSNAQSMADVLFPAGGLNTQENLKNAMNDRDVSQLVNQLGKSAEIIGTGFSRANPVAQGLYDQNISSADKKLQGFKDLAANEENDPNSTVSKGYQNFLQRYGVNAPGASASQIKNVLLPAAFRDQEQKERLEAKHQDMYQQALNRKNNLQVAGLAGKERLQEKRDHEDALENEKIMNQVNGMKASSRSVLGGAATAKMKAQRLMDLAQDPKASTQDMDLASADMNSTVSGTPSISGSHGQQYNNLMNDFIKAKNYTFSTTDPAAMAAGKAHMAQVAQRMINISDNVIKNNLGVVLTGHDSYVKRNPRIIDNITKAVVAQNAADADSQSLPAQPVQSQSANTVPMTKDGVTYKAIPSDRVEEAKAHGYR